jgi:hypothetical protein
VRPQATARYASVRSIRQTSVLGWRGSDARDGTELATNTL